LLGNVRGAIRRLPRKRLAFRRHGATGRRGRGPPGWERYTLARWHQRLTRTLRRVRARRRGPQKPRLNVENVVARARALLTNGGAGPAPSSLTTRRAAREGMTRNSALASCRAGRRRPLCEGVVLVNRIHKNMRARSTVTFGLRTWRRGVCESARADLREREAQAVSTSSRPSSMRAPGDKLCRRPRACR
jgi:hypothetical protein